MKKPTKSYYLSFRPMIDELLFSERKIHEDDVQDDEGEDAPSSDGYSF